MKLKKKSYIRRICIWYGIHYADLAEALGHPQATVEAWSNRPIPGWARKRLKDLYPEVKP